MKLERAQELYSDYKEGTLSPAMKLALEQHFEADQEAKQDYDDFARVFDLLAMAEVEEVEVPLGFRAKIMERAALDSAKRTPSTGVLGALRDLFRQPRQLQTAFVLTALAGVAVVSAVVVNNHPRTTAIQSGMGGVPTGQASQVVIDPSTSIVDSVSARTDSTGAIYHDFVLHLPKGLKNGTVDAYAVSSTREIRDADIRERQANQIVKGEAIGRDEDVTVPVTSVRNAPPGSTLNVVFDFHATTTDGREYTDELVVFTPMNPGDSVAMTNEPPSNGKYYDALQMLSSEYHVTIIADSAAAGDSVATWGANDGVEAALSHVAGGGVVKTMNNGTYFIYRKTQ